jgi:hypothetical protein
MIQQEAVAQALEAQAVVPVECDVPVGWSIDDYRAARGMAREIMEAPRPAWRRLLRLGSTENRSH